MIDTAGSVPLTGQASRHKGNMLVFQVTGIHGPRFGHDKGLKELHVVDAGFGQYVNGQALFVVLHACGRGEFQRFARDFGFFLVVKIFIVVVVAVSESIRLKNLVLLR